VVCLGRVSCPLYLAVNSFGAFITNLRISFLQPLPISIVVALELGIFGVVRVVG
jgi:hypothetical protein